MNFKDFFDLKEMTIGSLISWYENNEYGKEYGIMLDFGYDGDLEEDSFYLNSLLDSKGNNLYKDYVEENFFKKIEEIMHSKSLSRSIPPAYNLYEDKNGKKHLVYDLYFYLYSMLNGFYLTNVPKEFVEKKYIESDISIPIFRNFIEQELKCWKDVLKKGNKSKFHDRAMQILNIEFGRHARDFEYRPKTEEILNAKIIGLQKIYFASKKINRIFKDEVDFTKLMDCFDYDKICLLICYSMLKQGVSERTGSICPSMIYCLNYFSAIQEYLKYDVNYNPTILVYDTNKGKNIEISLNELYEEYKKILSKHPEYKYSDLDNKGTRSIFNEIIKYVEENNINELNNREFTEILRMFLFKKNYEKVSESEIKHNIEDLDSLSKDETSNEKKNRIKQQIEKMEFLLNNNPVDCIKGKGTFENYYGYIYPNGYIVFDTLDKDFNKSYGNAMFAMPVYLIDDLSEIKKRELRTNHSEVITAIVHRGNWKEKILDLLNKKNIADFDYDKTSTFDVSEIIDKDELEKLREIEKKINNARSENEKQELKKEYKSVKRKAQLEKIDSELKENEFDKYEIYPVESRETLERSDGEKEDALNSDVIEEMANSDKSFEELYEDWKNKHEKKKKARNPVVAAITKRRSMNENGRYCCEWCGADYSNTSPLRSHHVIPLCKGGPDNIYNTVCICPNCHDYVHSHEITDEEQYRLFEIIRKHIEEENPEYLPAFNEMMSPIAKDDEDYMKNKTIIDRNFELQWKDANIKKR